MIVLPEFEFGFVVGCWYFVVDISQELDLITTGQQSHSVTRRKWSASPHSALWLVSGLSPGLWLADGDQWSELRPGPRIIPAQGTAQHPEHPEHWEAAELCRTQTVCILNTSDGAASVIACHYLGFNYQTPGAANNESDCLIVLAI